MRSIITTLVARFRVEISVHLCVGVLVVVIFAALPCAAQGGPPFITDDPGTPGNGNWEVNTAFTAERHPDENIYNAPILDINYGVGARVQLKYQVPYLLQNSGGGPTRSGLGKSLTGVKWRFYDSDENGIQISTYPQLEFNNPTSSVQRGLADPGVRFFLPFEFAKKIGPVQVNPEVGYWFASSKYSAWATGVVVGREINKRLELDGELYASANTNGSNRWYSFDGGGRWKLAEHFVFLFMAGRSFLGPSSGQPQFFGYFGMQFVFSTKHKTGGSALLLPAPR